MKFVLFITVLILIFLAGCSPNRSSTQIPTMNEIQAASPATTASKPPSPTATAIATSTPTPTLTPSPSPTLTPTPTLSLPLGNETPLPETFPTLSAKNINKIQRIAIVKWVQEEDDIPFDYLFPMYLAIHPNSKISAIRFHDGSIAIVDISHRKFIKKLEGQPYDNPNYSGGLEFSADGKFLYSASEDKTLKVWDVGTWDLIFEKNLNARIDDIAVSPEGEFLALGTSIDREHAVVLVINVSDLSEYKDISIGQPVRDIVFSADGQYLAVVMEDLVSIWSSEDWSKIQEIPWCKSNCGESNQAGYFPEAAFFTNTDYPLINIRSGPPNQLTGYKVASGERIYQFPLENWDGTIFKIWNDLVVTNTGFLSYAEIDFLDLEDGKIIKTLGDIKDCFGFRGVFDITPNGQYLIVQKPGAVCIYGVQP